MRGLIGESCHADRRASGRRKPAERIREDELQDEAEPEDRQRYPGDDQDRGDAIEPAPHGCNDANDKRDDHAEDGRGADKLERRRHALEKALHHRTAVGEAVAPVAAHEGPQPRQILHRQRPVESHLSAKSGDVLWPNVRILEVQRQRSAGRRVDEREHQHRDDQQERDRLRDRRPTNCMRMSS